MWFGLIWHKYLWSSLGISMLMWNSEKSGSNLDISCILGETLSFHFSFFHLWNKDSIWYDLLCIGVIRINKGITMENFKDTLHKLNTNHLKKANFFLLCHFLLCRNGSIIVIFDLLFAQWVSDENVKEEMIQGIEANKSSQLAIFHIDVNSIDITGTCEEYLISLNC